MKISGVVLDAPTLFIIYTRASGEIYSNAIGDNIIQVHARYAGLANKIATRLAKMLENDATDTKEGDDAN